MGWWGRTRYPSARGVPLSRALTSNKLRLQRSIDLLSMTRRLSAFFSKPCACANRIRRSISARSSKIRACTRGMNGADWSHGFRNGRTDHGSGSRWGCESLRVIGWGWGGVKPVGGWDSTMTFASARCEVLPYRCDRFRRSVRLRKIDRIR